MGRLRGFGSNRSGAFLWQAPNPMELSVKTLSIEYQAVSALKPRATNPRTHSMLLREALGDRCALVASWTHARKGN
jgi:hypothetical protein